MLFPDVPNHVHIGPNAKPGGGTVGVTDAKWQGGELGVSIWWLESILWLDVQKHVNEGNTFDISLMFWDVLKCIYCTLRDGFMNYDYDNLEMPWKIFS